MSLAVRRARTEGRKHELVTDAREHDLVLRHVQSARGTIRERMPNRKRQRGSEARIDDGYRDHPGDVHTNNSTSRRDRNGQQRKLVVQDSRRGHRALSIRSRFATAHPCLPGLHGVAWQRWDPTSVHVLREVGTTSMNKTSVERLLKARSHQYQACMKACIRVCLPVYLPITFCTAHPEQRSHFLHGTPRTEVTLVCSILRRSGFAT